MYPALFWINVSGLFLRWITGTFDTINGLVIGNGKQFDVIYNAADVTLEVVSGP